VRSARTFATPSSRYLRQFGSIEDLMALSADSEMRVLRPLGGAVDPAAAGRLRLDDDHVATASFTRLHDGEAFCHTRLWLPQWVHQLLGRGEVHSGGGVGPITVSRSTLAYPPGSSQNPATEEDLRLKVADCLTGIPVESDDITWASAADLLRTRLTHQGD
jgi:GntR family transcriptional regulator